MHTLAKMVRYGQTNDVIANAQLLDHARDLKPVLDQIVPPQLMKEHIFTKSVNAADIQPITEQDVIGVCPDLSSNTYLQVKDVIKVNIDLVNSLPTQKLHVFDTFNGEYFSNVPELALKFGMAKKRGLGSIDISEFPAWQHGYLDGCTFENLPALDQLASLSAISPVFSTFIASHHIIPVLGGIATIPFFVIVAEEALLPIIYSNAAKNIRMKIATTTISRFRWFTSMDYTKRAWQATLAIGSTWIVVTHISWVPSSLKVLKDILWKKT